MYYNVYFGYTHYRDRVAVLAPFYSLPLLIGLLPNTYYIHYCALVGSISILLSGNISLLDLDRAHILMDEFCRHAGALYGESKCECIVYGALLAFQCETQGMDWSANI